MSNTTETLSDPSNWTAGLLMTINGVFGLITNAVFIHNFFSSSLERTSFNLICTFRAVGNFVILGLGFLATFVPLTIFGDTLFPPVHHSIVITIVNSLYTGLQNCGFLIAVNRFCAVFFMIFYQTYCTIEVTFIATLLVFVYRIFKIAKDIIQNIDVVDGSTIVLIALVLINIATFIKIYFFYKNTVLESKEMKKRIRRSRIMFIQTVLQDLTYLIDLLFTFKLMELFFIRYWTFLSGSLVWESVHSFDGLIMIIFNENLTFLKRSIFSYTLPVAPSVAPQMNLSVMISTARSTPAPIN